MLLVDDDRQLLAALQRGLRAEGYTVDVAYDGTDGLWAATNGSFDVIVLDIMMANRNGFQVCADLRRSGNCTPILMLTAKDGELDEAEALDTGADDYLTKPFSFVVLLARLRALTRRAATRNEMTNTTAGDLRVDPASRRAWRGEHLLALTSRQYDVLEYLIRHVGEVVSKRDILDHVWPNDFDGDPNIVEVYIRRVRAAVDEPFNRNAISTVRGAGYLLDPDGG